MYYDSVYTNLPTISVLSRKLFHLSICTYTTVNYVIIYNTVQQCHTSDNTVSLILSLIAVTHSFSWPGVYSSQCMVIFECPSWLITWNAFGLCGTYNIMLRTWIWNIPLAHFRIEVPFWYLVTEARVNGTSVKGSNWSSGWSTCSSGE